MDIGTFLLLAGAGMIGGICNAVAGGGTFFTFPALLAAGVPPVVANATSAVSIWPGHASSLLGYRSELGRHRAALRRSLPVVGAGSLVGATLLVFTGDAQFSRLVPWLILVATVLFALGPWLRQAIERHARGQVPHLVAAGAEFLTALYGGYFGAGLGIMLMAILTLLGVRDVQEANAVKNAMATVVTSAAVMLFVATGSIAWAQGSAVLLGARQCGPAGRDRGGLCRRAVGALDSAAGPALDDRGDRPDARGVLRAEGGRMMDRLQRARDAYACASTALSCIVDGGRCCFPRSAAFSDNAAPTLPPAWICQPDSTDGVACRFSWRTFCEESIR